MGLKLFCAMFFLPFTLLAAEISAEVTCWDGDCLKNGWTWENASASTDYACYRDGCSSTGWILGGPTNKSYTSCKSEGCFKTGWYQVDMGTQNLQREIVCKSSSSGESDCHKFGWTAYSPMKGQLFTVMCRERDCYGKGWTVQFIDGRITQVVCKAGGCYAAGWMEY